MKKFVWAICSISMAILILSASAAYTFAAGKIVPIYCVDTSEDVLSISFDAAWGADKTLMILDICDKYNVKVTFFLVGFWIDAYPHLVSEISLRGHEIGTHSETHPKMTQLNEYDMQRELTSSVSKIVSVCGKGVNLFRAPFGDYDNKLLTLCEEMKLHTIQWSIDSLDWKGISADEIYSRVKNMQKGDIILCHNNSEHIVEALPMIFECALKKGLRFVPVGELIYQKDYYIDGQGKQRSNA